MITKATATLIDGTRIKGNLSTEHAASSYGQPVFVGPDGAIDWWQIADISTAAQMGSSTSEAKAAAARENGKKGGRPRKSE